MKVNIKSLTPATLTINSLGNYIIRGDDEAQNVEFSGQAKSELLVLEREGLIRISYLDPSDAPQEAPKPKKGRGRPKGAKNKATLAKEEEAKEEAKEEVIAKEEEKIQAEDDKVIRNKTEAEAVTDAMGSKVIVTVPGGAVEGKMVNSVVGEAQELTTAKTEASVRTMEELEAEEADKAVEDKYVINEEDLDPSERMGGKAIISAGGDAKEIDLVNSILPESDVIKERDPFIDRRDNKEIEEVKQDNDDAFMESLTKDAKGNKESKETDENEGNEENDDTFIEV